MPQAELIDRTRAELARRGFIEFTRLYELNIVAVRNPDARPGRFDDELHVWFTTGRADHLGAEQPHGISYAVLPCSTDVPTWLGATTAPRTDQLPLLLAEGQYLKALRADVYLEQKNGPTGADIVPEGAMRYLDGYDRAAPFGISMGTVTWTNFRAGPFFLLREDASIRNARDPTCPTQTTAFYRVETRQMLAEPKDLQWLVEVARRHQQEYGLITYTVLDPRTRRADRLRVAARVAHKGLGLLATVLDRALNPPQLPTPETK